MHSALTIAAKELRQRLRDRSAIVMAFLLPFGLAGIFSLTLANVDEESEFTATYAVADLDGGDVATAFRAVLEHLDFVKLKTAESLGAASTLAENGDVDAAFVIPEGFSASASGGQGGRIRVITNPDSSIGSTIARSLAQSFASDVNAIHVSVATALAGHPGGPPDPAVLRGLVERARAIEPAAVLQRDTAENRLFSATTFYAAGMAVFFLFFTVEFGVRSLLAERETGTLARLLVAPMRPAWIIGGKALASFAVGLTSMVVLVVATTFLLGAEWGDPLGVGALVVSGVLASMGLMAVVSSLAKTTAQAGGYSSAAAVVLGLLGGTFFPISQGPTFLAMLSLVAPQAWLMRGFRELAGGGSAAEVLPSVLALLAFAAVLGGVAVARSDRLVPR